MSYYKMDDYNTAVPLGPAPDPPMSGDGRHWRRNGMLVTMTPLETRVTQLWDGRRRMHKLTRPFKFRIESDGMTMQVFVPMGFDTDWATIPTLCQLVLGNRDDYAECAVVHDWLCVTHVPRFICNQYMRSAMYCMGAPLWKRLAFFYGLMIFGYQSPIAKLLSKGKAWFICQKKNLLGKFRSKNG